MVDYVTGLPKAEDGVAAEAFVFMICGITGHWEHSIASTAIEGAWTWSI